MECVSFIATCFGDPILNYFNFKVNYKTFTQYFPANGKD